MYFVGVHLLLSVLCKLHIIIIHIALCSLRSNSDSGPNHMH